MGRIKQFTIDRILNELLYTMKKLTTIILFFFIIQGNAQDIFKETLFSADLVMSSRDLISLTDQQAEKVKKIHSENTAEFRTLNWELENANNKLKALLSAQRVNQAEADKQMDVVLTLENQLKKKQLKTLVGIKNELTENQQAELKILKYNSTKDLKLYGSLVQGTEKTVVTKMDKGSKSVVSVLSSSEGQPIFIVKQGEKEKKFKRTDNIDLDPNSIENITVHKGDSAWEMYGDEGKSGVVIITLKKDYKFKFD